MFNTDNKSGKPEVFLRPKESALIPIKYLTFRADNSVESLVRKASFVQFKSRLCSFNLLVTHSNFVEDFYNEAMQAAVATIIF